MDKLVSSVTKLMGSAQNGADLDLAARFAPIIMLDNQEPFRPQVVGYSIFRESGPSPSFPRQIRLSSSQKPAELVIEYAVWWDWDINHLYELEHIWLYLNKERQVAGLECSWHGSISDLFKQGALKFDDGHPIVLASPGKHAFAIDSHHFKLHQAKFPGTTSKYAGVNGTEKSNLYPQAIKRTPISDRRVQTYLTRYAFEPSWEFETHIKVDRQMLVPWSALESWIPHRVNLWYQHLEKEIGPLEYRPLRTALCSSSEDIRRASSLGLDMVMLNVTGGRFGFPYLMDYWRKKPVSNILKVLRTCYTSRIGVYLVIHDQRAISWLARLLGRRDWSDYLMIGSNRDSWLLDIKDRLPNYRTALVQSTLSTGLIQRAQALNVSYLHILSPLVKNINERMIENAHLSSIGLVTGPIENVNDLKALARQSIDALVVADPNLFAQLSSEHPED